MVVIDFCVRLRKDIMKCVLYCQRHTVRNVLQNEQSNIGINLAAMDAKRPVVFHALVGLAVRLQRSTSTRWLRYSMRTVICLCDAVRLQRSTSTRWLRYSMRNVICLCDNSRRFFIFQKQHPSDFERRVTNAMRVFVVGVALPYQWPTSAVSACLQWKPRTYCWGSRYPTESDHGGWKLSALPRPTHQMEEWTLEAPEWVESAAVKICRQGATDRLFWPVLPDYDNTIVVHRVKKLPNFEANYRTGKNLHQL